MDSSMKRRFSGKALRAMMLPLFAEQLLVMLVGIVDTLAVSYAGEAAGHSLALTRSRLTAWLRASGRWRLWSA